MNESKYKSALGCQTNGQFTKLSKKTNKIKNERYLITIHFYQTAVAIKISSFLSCPILETDIFIANLYIVLSCLIKCVHFLTSFVSIYFRTLAVLLVFRSFPTKLRFLNFTSNYSFC